MEKIINNNPKGYNELRNIIHKHPENFLYQKDVFGTMLKLFHKITGKSYHPLWKGFYYNPGDQTTPCHFFNSINLGNNPWKVHFETTIPRLGNAPEILYKVGIKKLASDNCKEILALSQCAYDLQLKYLNESYPLYVEKIKAKMKVQFPPQRPLIKCYEEKKLPDDKIIFTMVGADFFRKGGGEIIKVFDKLLMRNKHLHLNIVSSLNYGDYATHSTRENYNQAQSIIKNYRANITYYSSLSNSQVLNLFKSTHVGLLPTWADSFGYSVLEAQAAACPVITTDIRALPEINCNTMGWIIEVPKNRNRNARISSSEERRDFSRLLERKLEKVILEISRNPEVIKTKGSLSLHKTITNYEINKDRIHFKKI